MKIAKNNILKEYFKLFLAKGYYDTSILDIERATKIIRGAVFHHFPMHNTSAERINYVLPHVSSMFFFENLNESNANRSTVLTKEKLLTNLTSVESISLETIDMTLDELVRTNETKLLFVPGSRRFSYGNSTVNMRIAEGGAFFLQRLSKKINKDYKYRFKLRLDIFRDCSTYKQLNI